MQRSVWRRKRVRVIYFVLVAILALIVYFLVPTEVWRAIRETYVNPSH